MDRVSWFTYDAPRIDHDMLMTFILLLIAALLAYWEFSICEGAHLGRRAVVWLYDLTSPQYNSIKQFDPDWEQRFLGEPWPL